MARHPATDDATTLPPMLNLASCSVDSAGFSHERNSLYVRFQDNDAIYVYHLVPRRVFEDLLEAESKGAFINTSVKPRYPVTKLDGA